MGPKIEDCNIVLVVSGNLEYSGIVAGFKSDK